MDQLNIQELRLGNWVLNPDGVPVTIDFISSYEHEEMKLINKCRPIRISKEILEQAGFKHKDETSSVWILTLNEGDTYPSSLQWWIGTDHLDICRSGINAWEAPCAYLHQLQNLMQDLGKELKITPLV